MLEELEEKRGGKYRLDQILLVDDQGDNVRTAVNNGASFNNQANLIFILG